MKVLDLFSGIGGFSLGLESTGHFETVAFCECDPFCQKVLKKHWPDVPIYEDVRQLDGKAIGPVDLICGGFPCQPFSVAGKREGKDDDRHLWPEMLRLIREIQPGWVIGENVAGIISLALDKVLSDLEALGYSCGAFVIPACAVDAPHRRDRVWIVANARRINRANGKDQSASAGQQGEGSRGRHPEIEAGELAAMGQEDLGGSRVLADPQKLHRDGSGEHTEPRERQVSEPRERSSSINASDASSKRLEGWPQQQDEQRAAQQFSGRFVGRGSRWAPEPNVGRVAHGVPGRVDRLRSLGNAVVPQVVAQIGLAIASPDSRGGAG